MRHHHYLDIDVVIRITCKRRPSEKTKPRNGTWVVRVRLADSWVMPCCPEITWGILKKLTYLGSVSAEEVG